MSNQHFSICFNKIETKDYKKSAGSGFYVGDNSKRASSDWQIDFDLLCDEGKHFIFPLLKEFFDNTFVNINGFRI